MCGFSATLISGYSYIDLDIDLFPMLPKKHRIQRKDFDRFFKSARPHHTPSLSIRVAAIPTDDDHQATQCSCVISKKASKLSPMRHLIRRRVYVILREYIPQMPPSAIIVHIKKGGDFSFDNLKKEINEVMKKVFGGK